MLVGLPLIPLILLSQQFHKLPSLTNLHELEKLYKIPATYFIIDGFSGDLSCFKDACTVLQLTTESIPRRSQNMPLNKLLITINYTIARIYFETFNNYKNS